MGTMTLWAWYFAGQFFRVAKRAVFTAGSPKNTEVFTFFDYFRRYGVSIAVRTFICTIGFLFWLDNKPFVDYWLLRMHISAGTDPLPLTRATAAAYGFLADTLIADLGTLLQKWLPFVGKDLTDTEKAQVELKEAMREEKQQADPTEPPKN